MPGSSPRRKPMQDHSDEISYYNSHEHLEDREGETAPDMIDSLSDESLAALRRLARYKAPPDTWPQKRRAAVLVALFGSRTGKNLNVLLSTRSLTLRTFPGNVALPGGKQDPEDINLEATARREAFEEIGLPTNPNTVRYLTTGTPFLSRSLLLVTPVVVFILDSTLKPNLNPSEVDDLFSFPLAGFLTNDGRNPILGNSVPADVASGQTPFHEYEDYGWFDGVPHRYHAFRSKPKEVTGLTAEILIHVAEVAYGRKPEFDIYAEGEWTQRQLISRALKDPRWINDDKAALVKKEVAKI